MDENKMAEEIIANLETRVLEDLLFVRCPNCGHYMEWNSGGPVIERIDNGWDVPSYVEFVGFTCEQCNASAIIEQIYEPVSIEASVNIDEVKEW